jgi:hypothetical protein
MRQALSTTLAAVLAVAAALVAPVTSDRVAHAQSSKARGEIEAKSKAAMEQYDMLDFDAARKLLGEALAVARKHGLSGDPVVARVHLNLGVVYFAGLKDEEAAITAFADAVKLDPSIDIDVAYRTDQMAAVLAEIKRQGGGPSGSGDGACAGDELHHTLVDSASPGEPVAIAVELGAGLGAETAALYYRAAGATDYARVTLAKGAGCSYHGEIPATSVKGEALHYYVAAVKGGKAVASRGSSTSPNIIELGGGVVRADIENPLGDDPLGDGGAGGYKRIFVGLALGTGAGYVTGATEVADSDVGCCFAPALLHVLPELGYYFTRQTSASLAFRMGFALGANIDGHATAAPAVLGRVRHALAASGDGLVLSGAVGFGIIRHTVKVEQAPEGMDTDTTASGPFLVGAGLGYLKAMSGSLRLVGELNGLAAFPGGIQELGTCPGAGCVEPNFGFQFDLNLGLLVAF